MMMEAQETTIPVTKEEPDKSKQGKVREELTDQELDDRIRQLTEELKKIQTEKNRRNYQEHVSLLIDPLLNSDRLFHTIEKYSLSKKECRCIGEQLSNKYDEIFKTMFEPIITAQRQKTHHESVARRERRKRQKEAPTVDIIADTPADNIPPEMRTY